MINHRTAILAVLLAAAFDGSCGSRVHAESAQPPSAGTPGSKSDVPAPYSAEKPGRWVLLAEDGTPWTHAMTGLRFPQKLGDFQLHAVFRDERAAAGYALTYVLPKSDIKADVVIYPSTENLAKARDVVAAVHNELSRIINDLVAAAGVKGYSERARSEPADHTVGLWELGRLPMASQTLDLVATRKEDESKKPPINQWVGLLPFRDYYVQIATQVPAIDLEQNRKIADELITQLIYCVREPAVLPEMLKLCKTYIDHPLEKDGREAADALLAFSKESKVFEIALPGEALTATLNNVSDSNPDAALDLLRGFAVGSGVVALQMGSVDDSFAEGARIMLNVRELLQKQGTTLDQPLFKDLEAAVKEQRAAAYLKEKMRTTSAPK